MTRMEDVALNVAVELGMKIFQLPPHGASDARVIQKEQMPRTGLSSMATQATQATQATHLWCDPLAMWSELGNGLKGNGQRTKVLNFRR